jgi:hypothetical protein
MQRSFVQRLVQAMSSVPTEPIHNVLLERDLQAHGVWVHGMPRRTRQYLRHARVQDQRHLLWHKAF